MLAHWKSLPLGAIGLGSMVWPDPVGESGGFFAGFRSRENQHQRGMRWITC